MAQRNTLARVVRAVHATEVIPSLDSLKLTVVVPAYNEEDTIDELLHRVTRVPIPKEVLVVDDGSTDGTRSVLQAWDGRNGVRILYHQRNLGKGAAVRTALEQINGDVVIIQDADLECDPAEYPQLVRPILEGRAKVVYGSRFRGGPPKTMLFWHSLGNRFLTLVTNILFGTTLTDMETGYKCFTADIARSLRLKSDRWGIDPEITAKVLRQGHRIYEVPISYAGREYHEGKKIRWKDGLTVLVTLLRCRFFAWGPDL
jgi:glycosyltransferase involved in cell wall biosynthesis